ncbi:MFS transporter [Streptomyces sp. NPDC090442]|uniref:MFS transporter n=1 Tax=Streptomyces sp. NPDC090442 TaxID=3365962 RepID=UPI0037F96DD1
MATPTPSAESPAALRLGWSLALLALAQLIISIDYNIVFVALPEIGRELNFSASNLQWVVSAYTVVFGGFLLLGGRAADLLGRRRMFSMGLALYAIASLLGAFATASWMLITSRAIQGIGGAALFPATLALINTTFRAGPERNRALAVWGSAGASGLSLGAVLGGVLTKFFGWESVFLVNVPLAGGCALAGYFVLPRDVAPTRRRPFDLPGALLVTAGVTLVVYILVQGPVVGWTSAQILGSTALAVVLLALFALVESRSADPLMPLRLFANRNLSTATVVMFICQGGFAALLYYLTVYFQEIAGYNALQSGLAFLPLAAVAMVATRSSPRLLARVGVRSALATGQAVSAVGLGVLALGLSSSGSYLTTLPGVVVFSIGNGVTFTGMFAAAGKGVAPQEQGVASGMASTGRQVGGAVGLAVLVAVASGGTEGLSGHRLHEQMTVGLQTGVWLTAVLCLVGVVVGLLGLEREQSLRSARPAREPAANSVDAYR